MKIIFVCTGNTCRSPLAESIAKSLSTDYHFESRGIAALNGSPVSFHSEQIIRTNQLPEAAPAQMFAEEDSTADLILTMADSHRAYIQASYPQAAVYTLKDYIGENGDISDPYGGNTAVYERAYIEIRQSIEKLLEKLDNSQ